MDKRVIITHNGYHITIELCLQSNLDEESQVQELLADLGDCYDALTYDYSKTGETGDIYATVSEDDFDIEDLF